TKVFRISLVSWCQIIVALVIAMVISFLWIVMLRWIAGIIIWVSLFALIGLLGFGCFYCYTKYTELQGVQGSNLSLTEVGFTTDVGTYLALRDTWLAFGIIITITLIVILLILIFLRSRLLIAIALLKEGSRAVGHMMLALFFPLVPFVMQIVCFTWWAVVAVYLASSVRAQYVVADAQTGASQANWESCDPNVNNRGFAGAPACSAVNAFFYFLLILQVAIYGKNFCTSAKEAFSLLMRNIVRVVVLDNVTDFLLFLSKLMVVGAVGVVSFYFFSGGLSSYVGDYVPQLNYYFAPVIAIVIGSYVITSGFFNVYSMAVDTLFLCFLEDSERNNGSIECPYYMSKDLMHIVGKSNKVNKPNAW
ncbi:PREDICTED: choline transporter-like protein 2, partial [Priapulus caudatus]|uniref:Choline transporter-like protein n=1 Tax=Priapulus caudatus TaxID=37621 RepID=A0ABM1F1C7_PRICU